MATNCDDFEMDEDFEEFLFGYLECQPNESQICNCQNGAQGVQYCLPEGGEWEVCICDDPCVETQETCDGVDNDCDGQVDEGAVDASSWFGDHDGDGFGISSDVWISCTAPNGYVANYSDCDDADGTIYPDAGELCDDIDNDCDPATSDGADECPGECDPVLHECPASP